MTVLFTVSISLWIFGPFPAMEWQFPRRMVPFKPPFQTAPTNADGPANLDGGESGVFVAKAIDELDIDPQPGGCLFWRHPFEGWPEGVLILRTVMVFAHLSSSTCPNSQLGPETMAK